MVLPRPTTNETRPICQSRLVRYSFATTAMGNLGQIPADRLLKAGTFANVQVQPRPAGAEVNHSSLAFDQAVDSANMHLYAVYQQLTPDVSLVTRYSFTC